MQELDTDITVLGGGIVGVCCALSLQQAGMKVSLIDGRGVGEGCSRGNAGHFATEQILPLATPGLLWKIPGMLMDPLGPVAIRWSYLPHIAPWLLRFMLNTREASYNRSGKALQALNAASLPAWRRLLAGTGEESQIRVNGSLLTFERNASFQSYQTTLDTLRTRGVKTQVLNGAQARDLEPGLGSTIKHGVFFPETGHTANPYHLTRTLGALFQTRGGTLLNRMVNSATPTTDGVLLHCDGDRIRVPKLVLAAGAWSKPLVKQLTGKSIPLDTERGYHLMLRNAGASLSIPVTSAERRFIMTPMSEGLRLAGTVEFGGLKQPANMRRATMLATHARALLPGLDDAQGETWMGFRPSLPDSLPVIDRVGERRQIILAFGHQHLGLTQAALTGELVRQLATDQTPTVDIQSLRLSRF
ncbi:FAD-dependent oxidoreductase [Hahella sp. KA22]|uniref:NAD(P)/FAD-dependent oxidoreductase n=1 Tax=Hahella sp. KA22 TaxID=1628392 RepID=UPI000FDEDBB5|nr:FAD-dependent oxidoreductase [Hahella sp. KA22]AZZ92691.1 FAD-binding oxidoreductase [Hahella sp. KA22]QAY56065.1 FAD-dependent oxidoreductase [Hahella sp. KA22]